MNKNCKVVLLPTKDLNGLWSYKGRRLYYNQANFNDETETGYFHMYVLSEKADEKCKFYLDGDLVRPNVVPDKDYWKVRSYPEIIATTDKKLQKEGIASIDDDFIEWYCNNPVEEVLVVHGESAPTMYYGGIDSRGDYKYYCPKCHSGGSYMGIINEGDIPHCRKEECKDINLKLSSNGSIIISTEETWDDVLKKANMNSNYHKSWTDWLKENYEVPKKK